jgi:hypothetical protein
MTEDQILEEIETTSFKPLRLHLVSGKTLDVLRPDQVMPLRDRLLYFQNMTADRRAAETYNIVVYQNIERIEQLDVGKHPNGGKRRNRK